MAVLSIHNPTTTQTSQTTYSLSFTDSPAYLHEHFPDSPVFPAYIQLDWITHIVKERNPRIRSIHFSQVRFSEMLTPDKDISIEMKEKDDAITFKILGDNALHTRGTVTLQ